MKRTVTANISGIVFHIEEDAYRKLEQYLKELREHLSDEDGADEILEDIEARIAELFKGRTGSHKEVVTEADVEEVIGTMGRPEDMYGKSEKDEGKAEKEAEEEQEKGDNRVYRNPDDKVLGGVCSGISAYLGWDPLWLRLAFVLATLIAGTGPLLYIILWVIIPPAHTRAEKLHMHGEAVNLDNLKRRMKEEGEEIKDRFGRFKEEMKSEEMKGEGRKASQKLKEVGQGILYWLGKGAEKFGGGLLILLGLVFALVLFVAFAGGGDHFIFVHTPEAEYTFNAFLTRYIQDSLDLILFKTGFAFALGVPMLSFLYLGSKAIFGVEQRIKGLGPILFILWLLGLVVCIYLGAYHSIGLYTG